PAGGRTDPNLAPQKFRVESGTCRMASSPLPHAGWWEIIKRRLTMSDTIDPTATDDAPPRRLVRPTDARWLGGVAAGLGRYFDVNPLVYRIAFAALALVGGTGLLLYLAAWLVIPGEDDDESIAVEALRGRQDHPWLLVGVGLLAFGALFALSEAHFWPV